MSILRPELSSVPNSTFSSLLAFLLLVLAWYDYFMSDYLDEPLPPGLLAELVEFARAHSRSSPQRARDRRVRQRYLGGGWYEIL